VVDRLLGRPSEAKGDAKGAGKGRADGKAKGGGGPRAEPDDPKAAVWKRVQLARNLARQFIVYATGAPARFGDRAAVEKILQRASAKGYGVRTLLHEVVESELFLNK